MPAKNNSTPTKNAAPTTAQTTPTTPVFPTLSDIRETCAFVTDHAKHVHLNHQNLKNFAKTISAPPEHWLITNPHNLLSLPLPLLTTVLLFFEVIDFSFWPNPNNNLPAKPSHPTSHTNTEPLQPTSKSPQKWTVQAPSGPLDGSIALLYLLITNLQQNPALDFSAFSDTDFYDFFHPANSPTNNPLNNSKTSQPTPEISLLTERADILRQTSRTLREKLDNNFYSAIKNFTSDEQLFHFLIATFPSFRDQRTYASQNSKTNPNNSATAPIAAENSKTIHFYKLAQLLTSDLLFVRHHLENITVDTSHLPGCADYKIPQTLRALDLITYDQELSNLVDTQHLIPENSVYEVEIRAATVTAIAFLHDQLPQFSPIQINDHLFLTSRNLSQKQPYHLTRTTNY